jgi:elongation factor Tu
MAAVDAYIPQPERAEGPSVPDADRGRVLDLGPRHGGDGRAERGIVKVGDEIEIVGLKDTTKTICHGRRDVPQAAGRGRGGRQHRGAAARHEARGRGARPGAGGKPGSITPHTQFKARRTS